MTYKYIDFFTFCCQKVPSTCLSFLRNNKHWAKALPWNRLGRMFLPKNPLTAEESVSLSSVDDVLHFFWLGQSLGQNRPYSCPNICPNGQSLILYVNELGRVLKLALIFALIFLGQNRPNGFRAIYRARLP